MMKRILSCLFAGVTLFNTVDCEMTRNFFINQTQPKHIFINNRIIAKVNGKAISVIDLMKKLDLIFYRQFPQYSSSVEARYQFYTINWKVVLNEVIEKELIMADAEELKVEINHGDIRQEMENLFGPNIVANLDKAGLTYEEAWQMVKEDLLLKRMMIVRVNAKAVRSVTPLDIRVAYEDYAKNNTRPEAWKYQVISIKGEDPEICAEAANFAYQLLVEENVPINALGKKLEEHPWIGEKASYNISDEFSGTAKEVSEAYREILTALEPNTFSRPLSQKTRNGEGLVFRIFYLKEFAPEGAPPLSELETKIKNSLIDKRIGEEAEQYVAKLRRHFDIQDGENGQLYSDDFQPFRLN